jgi:predicted Zn finger-like uncharacterized protein
MAITTTCPGCKAIFRLADELAGQTVRCQRCAYTFVVPLLVTGQGMTMSNEPFAEVPMEKNESGTLEEEASPIEPIIDAVPPNPVIETAPVEAKAAMPSEPAVLAVEPPRPAAVVSELPPGRLWMFASVAMFLFGLASIGGFAIFWVATHLVPPPRVVLVPPLKESPRMPIQLKIRKEVVGWQNPVGAKKKDFGPGPGFHPLERQIARIIAPFDDQGLYEATHHLTHKDALEPSAPGRGPYKEYIVTLVKGRNYRIDVKSAFFAPIVSLFDSQNQQAAQHQGAFKATIAYTPNETGTYRIRAIAARPFDQGEYTIKIAELP